MPKPQPHHRPLQNNPGYTLIELMVVVMIAVLLMVITLPVAKTMMEDARPREASRILNTTFFTAKARAAQSGRLCGIEFVMERMNNPNDMTPAYQCTQMYMCEVPAFYMGDTIDARAMVNASNMNVTFSTSAADMLPTLLGNETAFDIRFNHRGLWYQCNYSGGTYTLVPNGVMPSIGQGGAIFQIRRAPVRVGNPVELPKSTAIDMTYSGVGPGGTEFSKATALRVMFAPAGNVFSLTMAEPATSGTGTTISTGAPLATVHFLVGLTKKINLPQEPTTMAWQYNDPEKSNLADGNALWVSVSRSSGVVTTNENAPDPSLISSPGNAMERANYFLAARQFATSREQKGGL